MNCHTVRALCELFGRDPQQLDAEAHVALGQHLDARPACREWRRTDRQVDSALASAMKNVSTPVGLERRIRDRLSVSRPPRSWGRIAAGVSVAAAVALVAVGVWSQWPDTVDLKGFAAARFVDSDVPSRESVEQHLAALGYRTQAPSDLLYQRFRSLEIASFQDRQVPRLTFISDTGNRLYVYILSAWSFSLPADLEEIELSGRHWLTQRSGGQIYVYEWTGNALAEVSNVAH